MLCQWNPARFLPPRMSHAARCASAQAGTPGPSRSGICLPFAAKAPPSGADWISEIKHDVAFALRLVPAD